MSTEIDVKAIRGNAPDDTKATLAGVFTAFSLSTYGDEVGFSDTISKRIKIVEVTFNPQELSPEKKECIVTSEIEVESGK